MPELNCPYQRTGALLVRAPTFSLSAHSGSEGLGDIVALLRTLPKPPTSVVMVVLHRPSDRISYLQEVLATQCGMPVLVASEAEVLVPGNCYIGEPHGHLTLMAKDRARLLPGSGNRLRNRTIDALFDSLAVYAGSKTIGVILSGSLDDGSRGLAAIHDAGGLTMVLDPAHKPRGMQQNAIDYDGAISFIGTSVQIAEVIGHITLDGYHR